MNDTDHVRGVIQITVNWCLILFMHSIVPHDHHESGEDFSTVENGQLSLFDWMKLVHSDMGEGHLDHFLINDGLDIQDHPESTNGPIVLLTSISYSTGPINESGYHSFSYHAPAYRGLLIEDLRGRGPPAT